MTDDSTTSNYCQWCAGIQGNTLEFIVQKLNQGTTRKHAVMAFGRPFLVLFWAKQKSTIHEQCETGIRSAGANLQPSSFNFQPSACLSLPYNFPINCLSFAYSRPISCLSAPYRRPIAALPVASPRPMHCHSAPGGGPITSHSL